MIDVSHPTIKNFRSYRLGTEYIFDIDEYLVR